MEPAGGFDRAVRRRTDERLPSGHIDYPTLQDRRGIDEERPCRLSVADGWTGGLHAHRADSVHAEEALRGPPCAVTHRPIMHGRRSTEVFGSHPPPLNVSSWKQD